MFQEAGSQWDLRAWIPYFRELIFCFWSALVIGGVYFTWTTYRSRRARRGK